MSKEVELKNFLLDLHEKAPALADGELYDYVLEQVVRLSDSAIGFFHLVSEDQRTVFLTTWNREALKNCTASYAIHYPLEQAGNWVDCVRLKRPVVYNDFPGSPNQKGLPEGHTPVRRFMSVPVVEGDRVRIIFGVGNKAEEYDERDVTLIQVVANNLQRVIGQRRAEEALRRSEAYFRSLIENASDMVAIFNAEGIISYASPSTERMLGYPLSELTGRNAFELVHSDDLAATMNAFTRIIQNPNESMHEELRVLHKDGSWRMLEVVARNLHENEVVRGIVVNYHDITARKIAENDLIWERNHLSTLIEFYRRPGTQVHDITAFVVEQCVRMSESPLGFFGFINEDETLMKAHLWSEQAMKGCAIDLKPVKFSVDHAGIWAEAIRRHEPLIVNDYLRPDPRKKGYPKGHVPIKRLMSIPIVKGGKAVAIMTVGNKEQDYTETDLLHLSLFLESAWDMIARKKAEEAIREHAAKLAETNKQLQQQIILRERAEEERRRSEQRLQQAEKAESLGRMAGAVAHHFNNLIGVVMGNLELAAMDIPQESRSGTNLSEAMTASRRAADISRLLLAYLGQIIGTKAPCDLSEICRGALPLLISSLPENVRLQTELLDKGPTVPADAIQIRQILTNLVVNAVEAMGDQQGDVTVAVYEMTAADIHSPRFYPPEWEPKDTDYACLSVSDNGMGMDPATQERIFDPFFSTKFTGRGLGLPVVLGMVKAHQGAISVESSPGRGSVFRVFLPLPAENPLQREPEPVDAVRSENRGLVLLVDDEPKLRDMVEIMLERLHYEVVTASDGIEALEVFRKHRDRVECVLLDLSMPRMNGWETLAALRAIKPGLPVILASGYNEVNVLQDDLPERPQAVLSKPYSMKALEAALCVARNDTTASKESA